MLRPLCIGLTTLLIAVALLFPPWRVSWQERGLGEKGVSIGHQWVFDPPIVSGNPFIRADQGITAPAYVDSFDVRIDLPTLLTAVAGIAAAGAAFLAIALALLAAAASRAGSTSRGD